MSWSMNELPCPSFEHALDDYLTDVPDEPESMFECDDCGCEIFEGDEYYEIGGIKLCENCVSDCKRVAEKADEESEVW